MCINDIQYPMLNWAALRSDVSSQSPKTLRAECVAHLIIAVGRFVILLEHLFKAVAVYQLVDELARSLL